MRIKLTACLVAGSILLIVTSILLARTRRDPQADSSAPVSTSELEDKAPAAVPSTPLPAQAPEVSESGAYRGRLTPSPETPAAPKLSPEEAQAKLQEMLRVENDGPNHFRIGPVRFDSVRRTVTIPAMVNMETGIIEYALVNETGKVHEALFATAAKPEQIHLACLLLGMPKEKKGDAADLAAKNVKVKVMWDTNGPPAEHDLSQMVVTAESPGILADARPLPIGPWTYTGSVIDSQGFAATREGSIIALIADPSQALLDNPRESAKQDDRYFPNQALLPPKGSSVHIILTLPQLAKQP